MIEKYLCTEHFKMDSGEVAFKKGKVYEFTRLPDYGFYGEAHFLAEVNEQRRKNHYMPESDMANYFVKVTDLNNLQETKMEQNTFETVFQNTTFQVGKTYKFNMEMKEEFINSHDANKDVFMDLEGLGGVITVVEINNDTVYHTGEYIVTTNEIKFFTLVEDEQEIVILPEVQFEVEVVKAWIHKLWWLNDNTEVYVPYNIVVDMEDGTPLRNEDSVEFVINSYNAYQAKEKDKEKQKLLDKKAELELELAQINKQLNYCKQ